VRWGQITVAFAVALAAAAYLSEQGYEPIVAVLGALVMYILIRWAFAWIFRTRFWYYRGGMRND